MKVAKKPVYRSWPRHLAFYRWWATYFDDEYNWLGHAWMFHAPRWLNRLGKSIPSILLALILWRVW